MTTLSLPLFPNRRQNPNQEEPASWVALILENLPEPVDPSLVFDRLLDLGFIQSELGFYDQLVYPATANGRRFLEWLEQQPANPYPDTGESGETYDMELEPSREG